MADDNRTHTLLLTKRSIKDKMYVDYLLKSVDTVKDEIVIYREMKQLFPNSGFLIPKWLLNLENVQNVMP